jgi:hypothetical protein
LLKVRRRNLFGHDRAPLCLGGFRTHKPRARRSTGYPSPGSLSKRSPPKIPEGLQSRRRLGRDPASSVRAELLGHDPAYGLRCESHPGRALQSPCRNPDRIDNRNVPKVRYPGVLTIVADPPLARRPACLNRATDCHVRA